jgi:small subunit ribosomal protein S20
MGTKNKQKKKNLKITRIYLYLEFVKRVLLINSVRRLMAHHKSALKRIRQAGKNRLYNRLKKKDMKKAIRSVREAESYEVAAENLKRVTKVLDKLAAKHIIHKNKAANQKSKLTKFVKKMKTEAVEA